MLTLSDRLPIAEIVDLYQTNDSIISNVAAPTPTVSCNLTTEIVKSLCQVLHENNARIFC